jgi:hypothetical protein
LKTGTITLPPKPNDIRIEADLGNETSLKKKMKKSKKKKTFVDGVGHSEAFKP